jgi:hypothetical protein
VASLFGRPAKSQDFRTGRRSGNGPADSRDVIGSGEERVLTQPYANQDFPGRQEKKQDRPLFGVLLRAPHRAEHDEGDEREKARQTHGALLAENRP